MPPKQESPAWRSRSFTNLPGWKCAHKELEQDPRRGGDVLRHQEALTEHLHPGKGCNTPWLSSIKGCSACQAGHGSSSATAQHQVQEEGASLPWEQLSGSFQRGSVWRGLHHLRSRLEGLWQRLCVEGAERPWDQIRGVLAVALCRRGCTARSLISTAHAWEHRALGHSPRLALQPGQAEARRAQDSKVTPAPS